MSNKPTGLKYDSGKPRMELLPTIALEEVAKVLTFGANKYGAWNWAGGIVYSRLIGAALRHIFAWIRGENLDPESGLSHLAHAACCILMIIHFIKADRAQLDDRYIEPTNEN